jgi:hypothetical protein
MGLVSTGRRWRAMLACVLVLVLLTVALHVRHRTELADGAHAWLPSEPRYVLSGDVVRVPGQPDRACAPTALDGAVADPAITTCTEFGVTIKGVDFRHLSDRSQQGKAVQGDATLRGILHNGTLYVTRQSAPQQPVSDDFGTVTHPDCHTPAGGWVNASGAGFHDAQEYAIHHVASIYDVAVWNVDAHHSVAYIISAVAADPIERALTPVLGNGLCVVQSRYSSPQANAARQAVDTWPGVYESGGPGVMSNGDIAVSVSLLRVTPAIQKMLDEHPKGLIKVDAFLRPET